MASTVTPDERAADRPLTDPLHDDFQRYAFAQRIAQTLIGRRSQESIVVGLYGKWGEGKSTVLNFLQQTLAKQPTQAAVVTFNPWRFPDESQLLVQFFSQLAHAIDGQLHTRGERAADAVKKYLAPLLPTMTYGVGESDLGKGMQSIADALLPNTEELRARVEEMIVASGKRVIVIIDDLDRLEKPQLQAVFRLVKLTADFRQTAYLLAFDDERVAGAIGELFTPLAAKDADVADAGRHFLEKIIQVPLRLPRAQPDALLQFCWNRLSDAMQDTNTHLSENENERLGEVLRAAILPRLSTPRLAVRLANAVQFSLPLLQGEVNAVDLLLLEAMRTFYPDLYQFIANNEHAVVGSARGGTIYLSTGSGSNNNAGDERHQAILDGALGRYQGDERRGATQLLSALFPRVSRLYNRSSPFSLRGRNNRHSLTEEELTRQQSIAADTHFRRYFSYTVIRGDVSDTELAAFLAQEEPAEQLRVAQAMVSQLGVGRFLQKISYQLSSIDEAQARRLWNVVSAISPDLSTIRGSAIGQGSSQTDVAAKLMLNLLARVSDAIMRRQLVQDLVQSGGTFALAVELVDRLRLRARDEQRTRDEVEEPEEASIELFTAAEWQQLGAEMPLWLLTRALREADTAPLYQTHPVEAQWLLFTVWPQSEQPLSSVQYVTRFLEQLPQDLYDFLAVCSSRLSMGGRDFFANLTTETVQYLKQHFGSTLYEVAKRLIGPDEVVTNPSYDPNEPTPHQRVQQFVYLYERLSDTAQQPSSEEGE
ncbi:KAP family NTPase [Hymenobacter sp. HSC-4F20]|uniref:KAP family P-loop NTPase fold protein n=1 Tax=Hymenobacter sp. HSC-4F20 TaxID=2864135 RepID=UPI001C7334E6|nr:P-loop NTPase fold protein [Hymenobacter sp. HSC-4F20]MBX0291007.1 KAP family NTPase [Hymenobacter sp. HSC-4F20]